VMKYCINISSSQFTGENYRLVILLVALDSYQNWPCLLKEQGLLGTKVEQLGIGHFYWFLFSKHETAYHSFTSLFAITK